MSRPLRCSGALFGVWLRAGPGYDPRDKQTARIARLGRDNGMCVHV
jgi:hypothetical protein